MGWFLAHLRNKLLAGLFSLIPIAIAVYAALWIEDHTKVLTTPLGIHFPGLGFLIAVVGLYVLGLLITSFVGRLVLRLMNEVLRKVPGVNLLYQAWKDVLVVSPDKTGTFHQVVLVPMGGQCAQLGFTSGEPLPGDPASICVLVPNVPSPFSGRLLVVRRDACVPLKLSIEEALKYQLSTGNYLPTELVGSALSADGHSSSGPAR
jgi:uncharacterized membrane protein